MGKKSKYNKITYSQITYSLPKINVTSDSKINVTCSDDNNQQKDNCIINVSIVEMFVWIKVKLI